MPSFSELPHCTTSKEDSIQADQIPAKKADQVPAKTDVLPPIVPQQSTFSSSLLDRDLLADTCATLGAVSEEEDAFAYASQYPTSAEGRRALVFWSDKPTEYVFCISAENTGLLKPVASGVATAPGAPPVLIDPRSFQDPWTRIDFSNGYIRSVSSGSNDASTSRSGAATGFAFTSVFGADSSSNGTGDGQKGGKQPDRGGDDGKKGSDQTSGNNPTQTGAVQSELPLMPIGAIEFLTFFPDYIKWPTVILRLRRNHWTDKEIAKAMLYAKGNLTKSKLKLQVSRVTYHVNKALRQAFGDDVTQVTPSLKYEPAHQRFVNHTVGAERNIDLYNVGLPIQASGDLYAPPKVGGGRRVPYTVADVLQGVVHRPTGQDAGQLTQALAYAESQGLTHQTILSMPTIVQQQQLSPTAEALTPDWDTNAYGRLIANVPDPSV